jgi:hypothetical protein
VGTITPSPYNAIKIIAIVLFLIAGLVIVFFGGTMGLETQAGVDNLFSGGFFTQGLLAVVLLVRALAILAVVFLSMILPGTSSTWWDSLAGTVLLLGSITAGYEVSKRRRLTDEGLAVPEGEPSSIPG